MPKFTCPYCYGKHDIKDCGLKCSFCIPGTDITCKHGVNKDPDGWIPNDSKAKCMKCTDARKRIYCSTEGVGKEIPSGFLAGDSLPIALVGAKASGKSNYIAVLIDEIRRKMTSGFNCTLDISCSEESKKYYDDYYYKPLFRDSRVVEGTDAGEIPPLIFPLRFMDSKYRIKKVATLTFYDTAGENFDSDESVLVFNRYIPNSKGIILLLDPLQIPSIRNQLEGKMPLPEINTDLVEILSRITKNVRDVKNLGDRKSINIPLALVFTKMDALEKFGIIPPGSCLREESEHMKRGGFVLSDFENTNIEMSTILENWMDNELLQMMRQFSKYSIFGLSALGGVPNGVSLQNGKINPKRVLDPLLWLLAENDYIKTIKK